MQGSVMVSSKELKAALRGIMSVVRKERDRPAFVSFEDGNLVIEMAGTAALVPAVGAWEGKVKAPRGALPVWADSPHRGDFVHVRVEDGVLMMGESGVTCRAVTGPEPLVALGAPTTFRRLVALRFLHDDAVLENAGLRSEVRRAMEYLSKLVSDGFMRSDQSRTPFPLKEVDEFADWCAGISSIEGASSPDAQGVAR